METECRIKNETGIFCSTKAESREVVDYLKSYDIENPGILYGTDINVYYGIAEMKINRAPQ